MEESIVGSKGTPNAEERYYAVVEAANRSRTVP
jgi:hypothetical protein